MNHIAHFLLAPQTVEGIVGTLLGDFHRGPAMTGLPPAVAGAVRLHRAIDGETDRFPGVHALKASFAAGERRFAGLALDLYFDHCLAREWPRHSADPLDAFVEAVYLKLGVGLDARYVPERMRGFARAMREQDWLGSYREFAGVEAALGRLNHTFLRRFQRDVELRPLADELRRLQPQCDDVFELLLPHLRQFAEGAERRT